MIPPKVPLPPTPAGEPKPAADLTAANPAQPATPPAIPNYELLRCIGHGSYGEVWLARNVMGTYRAVKIVYRATFDSDRPYEREFDGLRRFEPVSLEHESQVHIGHLGRNDREGYFFHVMELADDQQTGRQVDPERYKPRTLRSDLMPKGRLPVAQCLKVGLALTTALEHLHQHRLVHRDVKPSNVIFVNGLPKLADIGLVTTVGATCSCVGTEGYLPPEGPGSPQADLYSLGKVLYEMSTGKDRRDFPELPTQSGSPEEERAVMELNAVVVRACQPDARLRYKSAGEMHHDLLLLLAGRSVRRAHETERRLALTKRWALGLAAVVVLGIVPYYVALKEAKHARQAEAGGQEKLRTAYLAQAQAGRWSQRAGRRFEGLEVLKKAAAIRPGLDLRNEAIACMALTDLRVVNELKLDPAGSGCAFDCRYERYLFPDTQGTLHLGRLSDGKELETFTGFGTLLKAVAFSSDGRWLLMAALLSDNMDRVALLDLNTKEAILDFKVRSFRAASFSADSRFLAMAFNQRGSNHPVRVFDMTRCQEAASFAHTNLPYFLVVNPKQPNLLLTSDQTAIVRVWDWERGKVVREFQHPEWVEGVDWHPTGQTVVAACADNKVHLWDLASGKETAVLAGHDWSVVRAQFSPDGALVASWGWDSRLYLWDVAAKRELVSRLLPGAIQPFSHAGNQFGFSAGNGKVGIMEAAPAVGYRVLRGGLAPDQRSGACDFSPDGRLLVTAHDGGVRLWDTQFGQELARLDQPHWTRVACFHPNGKDLIVGVEAGAEKWQLRQTTVAGGLELVSCGLAAALDSQTGFVGLSHDGSRLALAKADGAHVFEVPTGKDCRHLNPRYGGDYFNCSLSVDGQLAAIWWRGATNVLVWEVAGSNLVQQLPSHPSGFATFSPNGQWLAVGDQEELQVWDIHTWQSRYRLPRTITQFAGYHAFSGDSRLLAVAISRSTVRLVEAATGRDLATLEGPDRMEITWLAFDATGTQLAVVSGAGPVQLWNLRIIRHELATLKLDWDTPPFPPGSANPPSAPLIVSVPRSWPLPLRDPRCTAAQIDLTPYYNCALTNFTLMSRLAGNDLSPMPTGLQSFTGTDFDVRGVVQLLGHRESSTPASAEVRDIRVDRSCRVLCLLQACLFASSSGAPSDATVGEYIVRYADGRSEVVPLKLQDNIADWWNYPSRPRKLGATTAVAWRGANAASRSASRDIVLYQFRWANPRPDTPIATLDFKSALTGPAPFLVAITAE